MNTKIRYLLLWSLIAVSVTALADKPKGFHFLDNRLTIMPYVGVDYMYDSNVRAVNSVKTPGVNGHPSKDDNIYSIKPGVKLDFKGDTWDLTGDLYYTHQWYQKNSDRLGSNSYGESLTYRWSSSPADQKGWSFVAAENFAKISQADSLDAKDGCGVWRDRQRMMFSGALERRFTARWHLDLTGQYESMDYDNSNKNGRYYDLNSYDRYSAGLEGGFVLSKWTDIIISGGYSQYECERDNGMGLSRGYASDTKTWTVMGGLQTRATERITYRALAGCSWLSYAGMSNTDAGWTYQLSAHWNITRKLAVSLAGSSYYQPSETQVGQAVKTHTMSAGFSWLTMGERLNLTLDGSWRYDQNAYVDDNIKKNNLDYDETFWVARVGGTYKINRWIDWYASAEWEETFCSKRSNDIDYNRFRLTTGLRFSY